MQEHWPITPTRQHIRVGKQHDQHTVYLFNLI